MKVIEVVEVKLRLKGSALLRASVWRPLVATDPGRQEEVQKQDHAIIHKSFRERGPLGHATSHRRSGAGILWRIVPSILE
eukprot:COSAG02_NODE_861_length_16429_cov_75.930680_14_plen_80_part_00